MVRFKSNIVRPTSIPYRPSNLVEEHIKKGNSTTSEVINSVLLNQKVSISQKELEVLLNIPSVKFDLPLTNETYPALIALVGKAQSRRSNAGVYIFNQKATGSKYVGSSNDLARRFKQYFEKNVLFNNKDTGLLQPLINKEGFSAFTLEVIVVPSSFSKFSHCFLEQYYLLDQKFNLNTHRIVNFRVNQGFKIFLYDKNCKTLYYASNSLNAFCADLGIHNSSYKKSIEKGSPFLDFFIISNTLVEEAVPANLTESEVRELIIKHRKESLNKLHLSYGKVVEVFDKDTNEVQTYVSTYKVAYRFGISRSTIRTYINNGKLYKDRYSFKFSDNNKDN